MNVGKNYVKIIPLYKHFAKHIEGLDWSDAALHEWYKAETFGSPSPVNVSEKNGYKQGKKWMDVTVAMWKEDFGNTLFVQELYEDNAYPHWWLDKVIGKYKSKDRELYRHE